MKTQIIIWLGVFLMAGVFGLAAIKTFLAKNAGKSSLANGFKPKALMTPNEYEFLSRLESAAPELRFHAQVSMGALLDPRVDRKDSKKEFYRLRGMFSQKIVDFVAQNRTNGAVVAIIELDDRTHSAEEDERRDQMLSDAGYKIIRWQSKKKPDEAAIREKLFPSAVQTDSTLEHSVAA